MAKLTVADLQQMKREGKKIAAVMCHDYQMAQFADRAGADIISVGDSLGGRFLGQASHFEITMDQMVLFSLAVTRGVHRAVVNCDLPFGPIQEGPESALRAAIRLVKEGHAETVKVDGAADNPEAVRAIAQAGIPVWAQFGFTPQTTQRYGGFTNITDEIRNQMKDTLVEQAKMLEEAGASMFDCTNVGNEIVGAIARSVSIPVIGGYNTGPNADGRVTVSYSLVGYMANAVDRPDDARPNVGKLIVQGFEKYFEQVREGTASP